MLLSILGNALRIYDKALARILSLGKICFILSSLDEVMHFKDSSRAIGKG